MRMIVRLSGLLAITAAAACASVAAPAGDINAGLVRAGVGVAGVELGMTSEQVEKTLGLAISRNATPDGRVVFMSFHASENFGVYFDEESGRVRMIIVAVRSGLICTEYDACLYREGDLAKVKAHYGSKLVRFVDRDGSVVYRVLTSSSPRKALTEFTPNEERDGIVQVAILYWDRPIDASSFD